ncbi:MAG: thiamine phosphate synthase [Clostridium sp.]|nr:thiamine phosphate synthase [Clostridium sp.]
MNNIDYSVYLVTDRDLLKGRKLTEVIEEAILGGTSIVQLREKCASSLEFYEIAKEVKKITDKYNVPLIINDRIDIALAIDASGVHLGQSDIPCSIARKILPKGKIIGVSAHNLNEAEKALKDGADYLGCGAVFNTSTKKDVTTLSYEGLKEITDNINIPIVAIGGINENNIITLKGSGINGVAVVSSIIGKENVKGASEKLKELVKKL